MITGCDLCVCDMFFNDFQKQSPQRRLQGKSQGFQKNQFKYRHILL